MHDDLDEILAGAQRPANLPEGFEDRLWADLRSTLERPVVRGIGSASEEPEELVQEIPLLTGDEPSPGWWRLGRWIAAAAALVLAGVAIVSAQGPDAPPAATLEQRCADYVAAGGDLDRVAQALSTNPAGAGRPLSAAIDALARLDADLRATPDIDPTVRARIAPVLTALEQVRALQRVQSYTEALDTLLEAGGLLDQLRTAPGLERCFP